VGFECVCCGSAALVAFAECFFRQVLFGCATGLGGLGGSSSKLSSTSRSSTVVGFCYGCRTSFELVGLCSFRKHCLRHIGFLLARLHAHYHRSVCIRQGGCCLLRLLHSPPPFCAVALCVVALCTDCVPTSLPPCLSRGGCLTNTRGDLDAWCWSAHLRIAACLCGCMLQLSVVGRGSARRLSSMWCSPGCAAGLCLWSPSSLVKPATSLMRPWLQQVWQATQTVPCSYPARPSSWVGSLLPTHTLVRTQSLVGAGCGAAVH
jgi:hypothetical protein